VQPHEPFLPIGTTDAKGGQLSFSAAAYIRTDFNEPGIQWRPLLGLRRACQVGDDAAV
jgi:hypothetical protein